MSLAALPALCFGSTSSNANTATGCTYDELHHNDSLTATLSCTTSSAELRSITITFECVVDAAAHTIASRRTSMVLNDQTFWDKVFVTRVRDFTIRVGNQTETELWVQDDAFIHNRFARVEPTLTARLPQAIATGTSASLAVKRYGGTIPPSPMNQAPAQRWLKSCGDPERN